MSPDNDSPMGVLPRVDGCQCHVCDPDDSYDRAEQGVLDTVLQHGWQVLLVGSGGCACCEGEGHDGVDDAAEPVFAYTVGLGHRAGHPDLLVSGLEPGVMHHALNSIAQRVLDGHSYAAGDVLEGVLGGAPVTLANASPRALDEVVTWSGWFHRRPPEALVVVWPSTSGVFAWQPGAPEALDERQPPAWRRDLPMSESLEPDPAWPFPVPPETKALTCRHVAEEGAPVLWGARQSDPSRGEDWSMHCGAAGHPDDEVVVIHLAHLVRGAPSVRSLATLDLDWQASRLDVDSPWDPRPVEPDE